MVFGQAKKTKHLQAVADAGTDMALELIGREPKRGERLTLTDGVRNFSLNRVRAKIEGDERMANQALDGEGDQVN